MKIYFSIHAGDSLSHVLRTVDVAKELKNRGHNILYASSLWTKDIIEKYNLNFISTNQKIGHTDLAKKTTESEIKNLVEMVKTEQENINLFNPDIMIADLGISSNLISKEIPKIRILHSIYLNLSASKGCFSEEIRKKTISNIEYVANKVAELCNSPVFNYDDLFRDKVIVPGIKEFEIESDISNINYIGPIINPSKKSKGNDSIVYVTMGTGNKDKSLVQKILKITQNKFEKIYISLGNWVGQNLDLYGHNAIVKPFFEGIPEDVGIVICHGGHGTTYQAIYSQKKIIAIPYNLDQIVQGYNLKRTKIGVHILGEIKGLQIKPDLGKLSEEIDLLQNKEFEKINIDKINDIKYFADLIEKI